MSGQAAQLAATHLPAWLVVPAAVLAGALLGILWRRQGRPEVPPSRRRIRRASIAVMFALVPLLAAGLSLLDPALQPRRYAEAWTLTLLLVLALVLSALLDALDSLRLHADEEQAMSRAEARALREAIDAARADGGRREGAAAHGSPDSGA